MLAGSLDQGLAGWLLGAGRPLVLAAAVVPAVIWVRRRPRRVYAAVGLVLLAPLALSPAWSPRDLVWPAVFGYLGDARWASIYAVAAGATMAWTSTWWGSGVPWHGGVDPATIPTGRGGRPRPGHLGGARLLGVPGLAHGHGRGGDCGQPGKCSPPQGTMDNQEDLATRGAVDNQANLAHPVGYAPPGGVDAGPGHTGTPENGHVPGNGSVPANGAAPRQQPYARERGH